MASTTEKRIARGWEYELVMFLFSLGLSYGFISLALDSAHTIDYIAGIFFLIMAIRNLVKLTKRMRKH